MSGEDLKDLFKPKNLYKDYHHLEKLQKVAPPYLHGGDQYFDDKSGQQQQQQQQQQHQQQIQHDNKNQSVKSHQYEALNLVQKEDHKFKDPMLDDLESAPVKEDVDHEDPNNVFKDHGGGDSQNVKGMNLHLLKRVYK